MTVYKKILVLPHLVVNNANAWSSPYTAGFPSVCSFGGSVHALQRKFNQNGFSDLKIPEFGIISHKFSVRNYREGNYGNYSIIANANPLDKNGERPSFVPEIKCMMEISLLCEIQGNTDDCEAIEQAAKKLLNSNLRIASGDVITSGNPYAVTIGSDEDDEAFRRYIIRKLMPGYALIERRELMIESMKQGNDALDALLEHLTVIAKPHMNGTEIEIERSRKEDGWLIPISTGYEAISGTGRAINQRDADTPHRFAESIVTLGEFRKLHRINGINTLLWRCSYDTEKGIYCYNQNSDNDDDEEVDDFISKI
jgi:CRISPR-associated protein Csy2